MKKNIPYNELLINPENYRFDEVDTEEDAIDLMLDEKGEEILKLAGNILEDGLDRSKDSRVIKNASGKYVVLDGNRRTTAIKCLHDVSLIKNLDLRKKFVLLLEKNKGKTPPDEINCYLYTNEIEAAKWIKLDHTGKNEGIGLDSWGPAEQERFDEKFGGKLSLAMQAIDLLSENGYKINPKKTKVSTANRLLSDPLVREYIGISKENGNLKILAEEGEVLQRIHKLLMEIEKDLKVKTVYNKENRELFVKKLYGDKPKLNASTGNSGSKKTVGKKKTPKLPKSIPTERKTLIPDKFELGITQSKLNKIYHELKKVSVDDYENLVAVGFRVFLEGSLDNYIAKNTITMPQRDPNLGEKMKAVALDLKLNNNEMKIINKSVSDPNSLCSPNTFNSYVHNINLHVSPKELKISWDNLQLFIEKIWQ